MKITPLTTNSFKGTPLFPVNIKTKQDDGTFKLSPAYFVELDYFDDNDCNLMLKINNRWLAKERFSDYASSICRNFFKAQRGPWSRRFFAIQLDNSQKDDYVKTASIMETTNPERFPKTYLEINFIQSATALVPGFSPVKAKGAGEQLIYGAVKLAQAYDLENISVFSTNDDFYEKIGLRKIHKYNDGTYYGVFYQNFDKFTKQIEEKYR